MNTTTDQLATKAVDGLVDGYPGNHRREWATLGQGAGAWIPLAWAAARVVERVVLFDRPYSDDRVMGGTLTFSDGSTVAVGSLGERDL